MVTRQMRQWISSGSAIRAMFEEGKQLARRYGADNVYDFSLGNPSLPAPEAVREAFCDVLRTCDPLELHGYMSNSGYDDVRAAIARRLSERDGVAYRACDVVMTVGAAGGMNVLLKSILEPPDEVVVFAPYFGEYRRYVENYGGILVECAPNPPAFLPDPQELAAKISPRTKAVIVNTPNNPTGVVYPRACIAAICDVLQSFRARGQEICLISDEPYRELVYDGAQATPIAPLYPNTVVCYSYSKSLSLPGERIGYLALHPEIADGDALRDACNVATRVLGFVNAPSLQQKMLLRCLDLPIDVSAYDDNRRALCEILDACGLEYVKPQGAFYLFVRSPLADDRAFCETAKQENLLLVPGSGFGCAGWVRVAYCVSMRTIRRSADAFARLARRCAEISGAR